MYDHQNGLPDWDQREPGSSFWRPALGKIVMPTSSSVELYKSEASRLANHLKDKHRFVLKHTHALHAIAATRGFANWNTLLAGMADPIADRDARRPAAVGRLPGEDLTFVDYMCHLHGRGKGLIDSVTIDLLAQAIAHVSKWCEKARKGKALTSFKITILDGQGITHDVTQAAKDEEALCELIEPLRRGPLAPRVEIRRMGRSVKFGARSVSLPCGPASMVRMKLSAKRELSKDRAGHYVTSAFYSIGLYVRTYDEMDLPDEY